MANKSDETPAEGGTPPQAKKSKKKLFIIAGLVVVLAGAGGGGWFYFQQAPGEPADARAAEADKAHAKDKPPAYVQVPEMVVNLRTGDGQAHFLKLHFTLAATSNEAVPAINERLPAVRDALQPFLRELRPEDLAGAAAVLMVKEELLRRARRELPPETLDDVLIQTMVQQ